MFVHWTGIPTDLLTLEAIALGFNFADIGLLFEDQEGNSNIGTDLTWDVPCDAVTAMPGGSYEILFVSDDADKCKVQNFDTTRLTINVLPPLNNAPQVVINNAGVGDTVFVNAGNLLDLDILASDWIMTAFQLSCLTLRQRRLWVCFLMVRGLMKIFIHRLDGKQIAHY
jgi:hypothetical protein